MLLSLKILKFVNFILIIFLHFLLGYLLGFIAFIFEIILKRKSNSTDVLTITTTGAA